MPLADVQKMTCLTHSTLKRPVEELEFTLMRAKSKMMRFFQKIPDWILKSKGIRNADFAFHY